MAAAPWNHNTHYHRILLAAVPPGCRRALDIGCGQGEFVRLLAQRVESVEGIDRSGDMIQRAKGLNRGLPNVEFHEGDFMEYPTEAGSFDFVSAIAVLHHMPFVPALEKARSAIRPGGVLAVLGLYRIRTPLDFLVTAVAAPINRIHLIAHGRSEYTAPVVPARMSLRQIRASVRGALPGARLRRHLLWRYSVVWQRP
jgi:SAM-dependent methyltransferase